MTPRPRLGAVRSPGTPFVGAAPTPGGFGIPPIAGGGAGLGIPPNIEGGAPAEGGSINGEATGAGAGFGAETGAGVGAGAGFTGSFLGIWARTSTSPAGAPKA